MTNDPFAQREAASRLPTVSRAEILATLGAPTCTAEDVENLAAARRAAEYHLPKSKLARLAAKYRPPQSWYEEGRDDD